jgi:hypothetical protein
MTLQQFIYKYTIVQAPCKIIVAINYQNIIHFNKNCNTDQQEINSLIFSVVFETIFQFCNIYLLVYVQK